MADMDAKEDGTSLVDDIEEVVREAEQRRQEHQNTTPTPVQATATRPDSYLPLNETTTASPTTTEAVASVKRRAIQAIMRDKTLSDFDKRLRVQNLMDGRPAVPAIPNASSVMTGIDEIMGTIGASGAAFVGDGHNVGGSEALNCIHYDRNCWVISPCCEKVVGCRICHDEMLGSSSSNARNGVAQGVAQQCGPMDRFAIKEIVVDRVIRGRIPKPTSAETVKYNLLTITVQYAIYGCLPPRNHGIAIPVAFAGSAAVKISITATYAACVFQ
eukprot:CAMPEP_0194420996 /NCGR_PEP_ID=MMETSP0176-20130528/20287_1 /TAXON_ID=216777 /ORGANISM="Proboscia alata, Strain PI-D3" /LENGTH=271 /DNA_ID=CAMNT_0039228923 /DNA_START=21 /DNA_END=837 /DNA_ORIENTATION=+